MPLASLFADSTNSGGLSESALISEPRDSLVGSDLPSDPEKLEAEIEELKERERGLKSDLEGETEQEKKCAIEEKLSNVKARIMMMQIHRVVLSKKLDDGEMSRSERSQKSQRSFREAGEGGSKLVKKKARHKTMRGANLDPAAIKRRKAAFQNTKKDSQNQNSGTIGGGSNFAKSMKAFSQGGAEGGQDNFFSSEALSAGLSTKKQTKKAPAEKKDDKGTEKSEK